MSEHFVQNASLRRLLLAGYRGFARAQLLRRGPRVFVNSLPKAGTHLLIAELEQFRGLQNSKLHIPVRRLFNDQPRPGLPMHVRAIADHVRRVRPAQFFSSHMPFDEDAAATLDKLGVRILYVTRDPRDILVSQLHYITGLRRHPLHDFITNGFGSDEERYRVLIEGHARDPLIIPLADVQKWFFPWQSAPGVLTVRFEDLVGERGGGSRRAKHDMLVRIADHIGYAPADLIRAAERAAKPTPTFRAGKANAWRGNLPDSIQHVVNASCRTIIETMGYDPS